MQNRLWPKLAGFGLIGVLLAGGAAGAGELRPLPTPRTEGGMPLLEALAQRESLRQIAPRPLDDELLSGLLWAAAGINRPESGKRTAPSASNWQGIDIYLARADGLYLYRPQEHALQFVSGEDLRTATGQQDFVQAAPLVLIFVADLARMPGRAPESVAFYAATDTGFISQNVYLFCAANELATVVIGWVDKPALGARMALRDSQQVILTQPVGYQVAPPPRAAAESAAPAATADKPLRDGAYRGTARGYVADIVVEAVVQDGRLVAVEVLEQRENRPRRALRDLPRRIVAAQDPAAVDAVTGATVTSQALKKAVRQALDQAR